MNNNQKILSSLVVLIMNAGVCFAKSGDVPAASSPVVKFLFAMLGVLISAGAIYFGLKLYKKFMFKQNQNIDQTDYSTLYSPKSFKEAINIFLDKTDK